MIGNPQQNAEPDRRPSNDFNITKIGADIVAPELDAHAGVDWILRQDLREHPAIGPGGVFAAREIDRGVARDQRAQLREAVNAQSVGKFAVEAMAA